MWIKIGYFPGEYEAFFSEVGSLLEKKECEAYADWEVSTDGQEHHVIIANVDEETFEEVKKICSITGLVAMPVSKPDDDPVIRYITSLLKNALYYAGKNKDEAVKRVARAIRALKNSDGLADRIRAFYKASRENQWLKNTEVDFWEVDDVEELAKDLCNGCWSAGVAFIWKDFCFIEQCNGSGEFAVFKYSNGKAFQFESITAPWMGEDGLRKFLNRIAEATDEQLIELKY